MARAAVKAKAQQQAAAQAGAKGARRPAGRRRHAGGGNPNQQLFFTKLRRRAKWIYVLLAALFAITFASLGVGSGQGGLDQLFQGINLFGGGGNAVGKAQSYIKAHPNDPKGFRNLATAFEAKGDGAAAATALQQYTSLKPKDAKAWTELAGLQSAQAQQYLQQYQAAAQNQQLAAPGSSFLPGGKLGEALGQNKAEEAVSQPLAAAVQEFQRQTQLAYSNAVSSYQRVTTLTPKDPNAWFQLGQAAQQSGDYALAAKGYKRYLALNPDSPSKAQLEQLIKELQPAAAAPTKKKK